jgi:hypothetical protein
MPNYSKNDIILVRYPFSDLSTSRVRPAIGKISSRLVRVIVQLYSIILPVCQVSYKESDLVKPQLVHLLTEKLPATFLKPI